MSDSSGRLGLRGLGLALSPDGGTVYPVLKAMWTEEKGGQQNVSRGMTSRGIKSLLERWAEESGRDRAVIEAEW